MAERKKRRKEKGEAPGIPRTIENAREPDLTILDPQVQGNEKQIQEMNLDIQNDEFQSCSQNQYEPKVLITYSDKPLRLDDKSKKSNTCNYCQKEFASAKSRWNHVLRIHHKKSGGKDITCDEPQYVCELCGKNFSCKGTLTRHLSEVHFPKKKFSCNICSYTCATKYYLKRHIDKVHHRVKIMGVKNFQCAYCTSEFISKTSLRRHEKLKHQIQRYKLKINRKCPLCTFTSSALKTNEIKKHFQIEHNVKMEWQKFHFQNQNEFNDWKNKLEIENNISFLQKKVNSSSCLSYYTCHRSGQYISKGSNKRNLRKGGSCKINAFCPCEIIAKTKEDGQISVKFLPTHVGHKNELKYLNLKPADRRSLAALLLFKVPHDEILKGVRMTASNKELKRIHLINKKDLINIEKSFSIDKESEEHPYNPVSIGALVNELTASEDTSQLIAHTLKLSETMDLPDNDNELLEPVAEEEMDRSTEKAILTQISQSSCDEIEKKREALKITQKIILEEATTLKVVDFANETTSRILQSIKAMKMTAEQPFQFLETPLKSTTIQKQKMLCTTKKKTPMPSTSKMTEKDKLLIFLDLIKSGSKKNYLEDI